MNVIILGPSSIIGAVLNDMGPQLLLSSNPSHQIRYP